jgi:hypothetical protein
MDMQLCPVGAGKAICSMRRFSDPVPVVPNLLSVSCEQCGEFSAIEGFFPYEWNRISAEDKRAIAAYLKETKGDPPDKRTLAPDSWRHMAHQGKQWLEARSCA